MRIDGESLLEDNLANFGGAINADAGVMLIVTGGVIFRRNTAESYGVRPSWPLNDLP